MKKVSIIIATYNRGHFIAESLHSIVNQTHTNWECIIIDDGGNDNTAEVVAPFLAQDKRISFQLRKPEYQKGLPGSRNYGLDLATGDYIIFFDDDDVVHPRNLEFCVKELEGSSFRYCRYLRGSFEEKFDYKFDNSDAYSKFIIEGEGVEKIIDNTYPISSNAVMWRADCYESIRYVEHLMYAEEWECYTRILLEGGKGISIDKELYFARQHINSNTGEFWSKNKVRVGSMKDAICLVAKSLQKHGKMSEQLKSFLVSYAMGLRDFNFLIKLLPLLNVSFTSRMIYMVKFVAYPFWKIYVRLLKANK